MAALAPFKIVIEDVHPFSGMRPSAAHPHRVQNELSLFFDLTPENLPGWKADEQLLLLFEWPNGKLGFHWRPRLLGASAPSFSAEPDKVRKFFTDFGVPEINLPPSIHPTRPDGRRFQAVVLPLNSILEMEVQVDTDRPEIVQLSRLTTCTRQLKSRLGEEDDDYKAIRVKTVEANRNLFPIITSTLYRKRPPEKRNSPYLGALRTRGVVVNPQPLEPMPGYLGYVALDVGNTGSMLAFMVEDEEQVENIKLLMIDPALGKKAVPTAIRVTQFTEVPPAKAAAQSETTPEIRLPNAEWSIGREAIEADQGALVLGAKRILADPDRKSSHQVWLNGERRNIPKSAPAELFVASMVHAFHSQDSPRQIYGLRDRPAIGTVNEESVFPCGMVPNCSMFDQCRGSGGVLSPHTCGLAVTCPTTFSSREIENLRRAVYAGWMRALGKTSYQPDPDILNRVIDLVVDEASAAALFFIYKDFLRGPAFARALPYLYPNGFNILIYDCGGGTTDIALVHAFAVFDKGQDRVRELRIEVIGRTGHRGFGGDNITIAVFKLLKAKLALKLAGEKALRVTAPFEWPADLAQLPALLERHADAIDKIVPTTFLAKDVGGREARERSEPVLELWQHAEDLKRELELKTVAKKPYPHTPKTPAQMGALLTKKYSMLTGARPVAMLSELEVSSAEVNALIVNEVRATVERANGLVRRKLGAERNTTEKEPPAPAAAASPAAPATPEEEAAGRLRGAEVHKVYVLGNASRYPLIRKCLEDELEVRFLKGTADMPGRLIYDEENLKGAVAKGAVTALRLRQSIDGVEIKFDNSLIKRLQFDIWYTDIGDAPTQLYGEGQILDELPPTEITAPPPPPESDKEPNRTVTLKRQWPDESHQSHFLTFRFSKEIAGPLLRVEYIPATGEVGPKGEHPPYFRMMDEGTGETVVGEERPETEYISPPQSGKL